MSDEYAIIGTTEITNDRNIIEFVKILDDIAQHDEYEILEMLDDNYLIAFPDKIYSGIDGYIGRIYTIYYDPEWSSKFDNIISKVSNNEYKKMLEKLKELYPMVMSALQKIYGYREKYIIIY